jgi:molybdopterin converting factor small subunit
MGHMYVEIMPWFSRYFAAEHTGRLVLTMEVGDGITVRELLDEISADNRPFRELAYDPDSHQLAGYVMLLLNGRLLELAGGMEARLKAGDTIRILPGFSGG